MSEVPHLLVDWDGRWRGFVSSLRVVFSRSPGGEQGSFVASGIALRTPFASLFLHCALVFAWMLLSPWFFLLFPASIPISPLRMVPEETVYFFPAALPQIGDVGGARSGAEGRPGGKHAFHPLQTIRIARGPQAVDTIVDAPKLNLPRTHDRVANLLAFSGAAPAPPVDAVSRPLRQTALPGFAPTPVAPATEVAVSAPLRAMSGAAQFLPSAPSPIPQTEIRNSLTRSAPANTVVAVPPLDLVTRVPKLALPAAQTVPPVAPLVARNISDVPGSWAADAATVAPPKPAGAAGPAGATGSGSGAGQPESPAASQFASGAVGHGASSGGEGDGVGGGNAQGLIVSLNPGDKLGIPDGDAKGSLAMSPAGRDRGGLGGSGGGEGIGRGSGPGSGASGAGPGSGSTGTGPGSANAAVGLSPLPGPGGAGQVAGTLALVPGVTIQGNVITIPSFAAAPASPTAGPSAYTGPRRPPTVVVIASSRAGGGMNAYGALKGSRVYTTYIDTRIGTAVLQYSDPASHPGFEIDLTPPEPMLTELAPDIKSAHVVVKCVMEKTGKLRDLRVLESQDPELAVRLVTALRQWLFRPAFKRDAAIDVEAILGFGITTR